MSDILKTAKENIRLKAALSDACEMISKCYECPCIEKDFQCDGCETCDDEAECWKKYFLGDKNE